MKRKIFYRVFTVSLVAALMMFVFGIFAVNMNTNNIVSERLKKETGLAAALMNDRSDFPRFDKYADNPELRITVFDLNGNVLYESDTTAALENHADRKEIRNALAGKPEAVRRYSETFGCNMTYYAEETSLSDGEQVILRLAVRSSQITPYFSAIIPLFILVLLVSLVLSFILSSVLSRGISARVTEIGESLKSLNDGRYTPIRTDRSEPELCGVFNQINGLNANIHSHIRIADGERAKLNAVLDNISQSIVALDGEGRIAFANRRASVMLGGSGEVGAHLSSLIPDGALCEKILSHVGEEHVFPYTYGETHLAVTVTRVVFSGICAIVILTDVTKEKLIERQKSDFFANASHELKTPVTVMQGFAEVLMNKEGIDEASRKQLARIYGEGLRLSALISDMLMLSKMENGEARHKALSRISLGALAAEILGELGEEIKKKSVKAEIVGQAELLADHATLYELIENLISNAVKYNREGGSVTVSLSESASGVTLRVLDTGIGIEREHLPRLCERFYRVDKSHSRRIGGTGLGLAIVKHICASCGATLSIDSEYGVGTEVTVVFAANGFAEGGRR